MSKCSQRRVECLLFDEGEDGRVLDYFDSYTKANSLTIFQVQVQFMVEGRDGNSSKNFIPREIEESRNGKFTFLGDRGR